MPCCSTKSHAAAVKTQHNGSWSTTGPANDCYNKSYLTSHMEKLKCHSLVSVLHETSLRGFCAPSIKLFAQGTVLPTTPFWSLEGRHDMYCGIFNTSGDRFFSGSHDGVIRIFDSSHTFFGLVEEIRCPYSYWSVVSLRLSPNERRLVFSILTSQIQMVSLDDWSGADRVVVIGDSPAQSVITKTFSTCFDGSSSRVYAGHNAGYIGVFDLGTGKSEYLEASPSKRDINAVTTVDPGGHTILTGGDDTNIRLFDVRSLNEGAVALFVGHADGITYLDAQNGGFYFLSNSKDQTVRLWDIRKHTKQGKERQNRPRCNWDYRIHPIPNIYNHPRHWSSGSSRGDQSVMTLRGHTVRFTLIRARFSPAHTTGQRYAYSGSTLGGWCIWDLYSGKLLNRNSHGSQAVRDVHWHPWEPKAVASEMNGSLTCWRHIASDPSDSSVPSPSTCTRSQFQEADPDGQRYRIRLEQSGFRYRFLDNEDSWLTDSSRSSLYILDDDDEEFEALYSDSSEEDYRQILLEEEMGFSDADDPDYLVESELGWEEVAIDPPVTRGRNRRPRTNVTQTGQSSPPSRTNEHPSTGAHSQHPYRRVRRRRR